MSKNFEIIETKEFGLSLKVNDVELADAFEDFLNEECYVLFDIKFEGTTVIFYFGVIGAEDKLRCLIESFEKKTVSGD